MTISMAETQQEHKTDKIDTKYRKLYRSLIDKSKKLDEIYRSPNSFLRLFQSETTLLREKIKDYCETLIFREPIEYAKKAEEILWRRVFYEIIHIVKSNKKNLKCNAEVETMYRLHLSSAYGFYNHLILRFQSEFNSFLQLDGFLDFPLLSIEKQPTIKETSQENRELLKEVATRILHKFLICLGDLARYQIEYDPNGCTKLAYKYYQMSMILMPSNGMPLNQLGTLYGSENYGCDAAYYYLYCLCCSDPFLSASENLRLLFAKNRKRYDEIKSKKYIDRGKLNDYQLIELRTKEIKKFLVLFLYIIDLIYTQSTHIDNQHLQEMCQLCLQEFNSCMFYTTNLNDDNGNNTSHDNKSLSHISDELVFKLTLIILMTIENLKSSKRLNLGLNTNNTKIATSIYFTSVAFALVFFSHIVNHTIIRLQESLLSINKKNKPLVSSKMDEQDEDMDEIKNNLNRSSLAQSDENKKEDNNKEREKPAKKRLRLIYGQRRRKHNSDSDTNEEDESDSSDNDDSNGNSFNSSMYSDEDEEGTVIQSSSGGSSSGRHRNLRKKTSIKRKKNIAKFVDRENLSETEFNTFLTDNEADSNDDDDENSDKDSNPKQRSPIKNTPPKQQHKELEVPLPIATKQSKLEEETLQASDFTSDQQVITDTDFFQMNYLNNAGSVNFKEISSQLISSYSIQQKNNQAPQSQQSQVANLLSVTTDEFISNELYKFVLNGKQNVTLPPGFDPKEAKEIEELGQKIATFQIETDTEMSLFNTDTSSSTTSSSSNSSNEQSEDFDDNMGLKNLEKLSEIKKNRLKKLEVDSKSNSIKSSKLFELKQAKQIVEILESQGLLSTIKVFCDWLLCNKKIIQSISQVSITMWPKLAILLNCIPTEKLIASEFLCSNEYLRNLIMRSYVTKSWNCQPLPEDLHLRSFNALRLEHASLNFDINKLNQLSLYDEHLLRLCNLRRFGYMIASFSKVHADADNFNFFEYDVGKQTFNAPIQTQLQETPVPSLKKEEKAVENQAKADRRVQLMKSMAQLRLEAEICQLESSTHKNDSQWSPYIVPDTLALCFSLKFIQELTRMNKFILIIPLVVIDNLDRMKKDSKLAREAIRWLENQFKQGNRFMRAQNQNEKISSNETSNLINKKKDLDAWCFLQLVDCCKYFQQEASGTNNVESNKQNMVTLLTSDEKEAVEKFQETNFKLALNYAKENDIEVIGIKEFYDKCKKNPN